LKLSFSTINKLIETIFDYFYKQKFSTINIQLEKKLQTEIEYKRTL